MPEYWLNRLSTKSQNLSKVRFREGWEDENHNDRIIINAHENHKKAENHKVLSAIFVRYANAMLHDPEKAC